MARPKRKGLSYFPLDTDIFSDRKIRILMARYGLDGFTLYVYILCQIYRDGYYTIWDDDCVCIASSDLNMSIEKIGQISNFLLERSLFDHTLFQSDKVLTSNGIQRRYQQAVKTKAVKTPVSVDARFWILSKEETEAFIKVRLNSDYSEKNTNYSEKNVELFQEKPPQSKVNKSKVNKSKVVVEIPATDGMYQITETQLQQLQQEYNSVDVKKSLENLLWYVEHRQDKRKSRAKMAAYIHLWLKTDKDSGKCALTSAESSYGAGYDLAAYEALDPFADIDMEDNNE